MEGEVFHREQVGSLAVRRSNSIVELRDAFISMRSMNSPSLQSLQDWCLANVALLHTSPYFMQHDGGHKTRRLPRVRPIQASLRGGVCGLGQRT